MILRRVARDYFLLQSTDAGQTFQAADGGLPRLPLRKILTDPTDSSGNTAYVANVIGQGQPLSPATDAVSFIKGHKSGARRQVLESGLPETTRLPSTLPEILLCKLSRPCRGILRGDVQVRYARSWPSTMRTTRGSDCTRGHARRRRCQHDGLGAWQKLRPLVCYLSFAAVGSGQHLRATTPGRYSHQAAIDSAEETASASSSDCRPAWPTGSDCCSRQSGPTDALSY
jgi:hypothetical protein